MRLLSALCWIAGQNLDEIERMGFERVIYCEEHWKGDLPSLESLGQVGTGPTEVAIIDTDRAIRTARQLDIDVHEWTSSPSDFAQACDRQCCPLSGRNRHVCLATPGKYRAVDHIPF